MLSYAGAFQQISLSVTCCTFGVLVVGTITPNRFKNQSIGTLKILVYKCKILCVHSSPIIYILDVKKLALSIAVGFHKSFQIVVCFTFGRFKIITLIPSRFKNQTNDALKLLDCNQNHYQGFVEEKMFLSIIVVLKFFIKIAIFDKLYQCNSCKLNFEQHWIKCLPSKAINVESMLKQL